MEEEESKERKNSNDSSESENLTYNVINPTQQHKITTENNESADSVEIRPVPAPRRRTKIVQEQEKFSSDTDKDITEIDLDEGKTTVKQNEPPKKLTSIDKVLEMLISVPTPKPRKIQKERPVSSESNSEHDNKPKSPKEEKETQELPIVKTIKENVVPKKEGKIKEKLKKETEKGKIFPKSEKKTFFSSKDSKLPKVSLILKEFKKEEKNVEEETLNFSQFVSDPKIYVQGSNGFQIMEKDEVLGKKKPEVRISGNREMNQSTVEAAVLFQKYWSRCMEFFQGILAGFAVSHAAAVTAVMVQYDFEPKQFYSIYSCFSLKVQFVFYSLTTLSVVTCLDRIDVGHVNKKHWRLISKSSSMWFILFLYLLSSGLTFANHKQETRFEAFLHRNTTEGNEWETQDDEELKSNLLTWYQIMWVRDVLLLLAWFLVSLSKFKDFLHDHLSNMSKCVESKEEVSKNQSKYIRNAGKL